MAIIIINGNNRRVKVCMISGCKSAFHKRPPVSRSGACSFMPCNIAKIPKPAKANTAISPKVSVPLKSTKITLTTLVPPPPGTEFNKKYSEIGEKSRVNTAMVNSVTPTPDNKAMTMSRLTRKSQVSLGVVCGKK